MDYSLHNATVHFCEPDTHVGADHQQPSQNHDVKCFLGFVRGDRYLDELLNALDEDRIDISFSALYIRLIIITRRNRASREQSII